MKLRKLCTCILPFLIHKVFRLDYCLPLTLDDLDQFQEVCKMFVQSTQLYMPEFKSR